MAAQYDESGNYVYPEGFDPETGEWLPGYEEQQAEWERQYAEAQARYEAHLKQLAEQAEQASTLAVSSGSEAEPVGTLASDEQLAELRERLAGGQS
jgi:small subunit ribosomal protein S1